MSANEVRTLKRFFELKSLHVSDYWLQCCLEWFKGEYNTYTEDFMCSSVYQQWLDSDLRDIEVRSLPNNLAQQKVATINGKYALQVMYIKDIAISGYSQVKNIRDMYKLTRSHVDKEDNDHQELSGKRMLYLHMTDGVQEIRGFEYGTVRGLSLYLTPGIKLLVTGPVTVRNGEFLFKENNVTVLGGEVEDLKITNAAENVLAKELNMTLNSNPKICDTNSDVVQKSVNNQRTNQLTIRTQQENSNGITNNKTCQNNMLSFEDSQFFAGLDNSIFEQQESVAQAQINLRDADFNDDDDLFKDLNITETENEQITTVTTKNYASKPNVHEFGENIEDDGFNISEEFDRQAFERQLEEEEMLNSPEEEDVDIVNKIIEQQSKKQISLPVHNNSEPFIYIRYLVDNVNLLAVNKIYRVKAWFEKNIEKLKLSKNEGWTMKFTIKDASGNIIVNFSSVVIEDLMGLSPSEALAENRSVKNKEIKSHEKLTQALAACKEKLEAREYLMDLKFMNTDKSVATIISLQPVRKRHLEEIKERVQNVSVKLL